jgi:O-succinylbenzoic acid--CoA ligase
MMDLLARCPASGAADILDDGADTITLDALTARVAAAAAQLRSDPPPGGVHLLSIESDFDGIIELLATWAAGLVAAPLNPMLTPEQRTRASEALSTATLPEETCTVLWTSGTSGTPRGVALSWASLEASARGSRTRLDLRGDDVWLASLSPAHVGGVALVTRALLLGNRLVASGRFDVERAIAALESDAGPTHLSLVPTQLHRLLDAWRRPEAPSRLRCILIGGAHAPSGLVTRAVRQGWPIALTYGATEMTSQIATATPAEVRAGPLDVGVPLPGVEVLIADDGEILARGATRALAYVAGDSRPLADPDGWYHTGDIGRLDSGGRLTVTGRRIDRIVTGGVTLDAIEIEEALRGHPAVHDVCVVGVPDEVWGERVAAWVEPVEGEFDLDDVESWASEALGSSSRPRLWKVGGTLPRNANGKVDRAEVRSAF